MKLQVKYFGPITGGTQSGDPIHFKGVTLFIGEQGTGKSTIAKLATTMAWIEKSIVRGDYDKNHYTKYKRFEKQLEYQRLRSYITPETEIRYEGQRLKIDFTNGVLSIHERDGGSYSMPKIMYIPAERNFVSSVDRPELIKRLPKPIFDFLDEYELAKSHVKGPIDIHVGKRMLSFEHNRKTNKSFLVGDKYKIELLNASSGFQSLIPLLLVSNNLARIIQEKQDPSIVQISQQQRDKIIKEMTRIISENTDLDYVNNTIVALMRERYVYGSFINVVEEPEQNLYPTSQQTTLYELLSTKNSNPENKLVITTHSPYLLSYMSLAMKAHQVLESEAIKQNPQKAAMIYDVVPQGSTIDGGDVSIYELDTSGAIRNLSGDRRYVSDENKLNAELAELNEHFSELLDIEG